METSGDRFVGRAAELARLRSWLADARRGAGRVVVVDGPAGIGKTRLVEELVAAGDVPVGWGGAVDDAGMPALWPWTRVVRGWPDPCVAVALLTGAAAGKHGSAEDAAAATFSADADVIGALEAYALAAGGLLIVLDDLQWADQASIRLLERLAAHISRMPLLVVVTHRDTAGHAGTVLRLTGPTDILTLAPLPAIAATEMLSAAVTCADPAALRRAVHAAGGSPLYLRTLSRVAADQLRGTAPWDTTISAAPELRHLVAVALQAARPAAREAVEALSVLGVEADAELVGRLIGAESPSTVLEQVLPAVSAGIVAAPKPGSGRIAFAHGLVRDAVYATLQPSRRSALHRRAADLLEPLAVRRDDRAGPVAWHWYRADEPGRAIEWAVRAAHATRAAGAYNEAASYLSLALEAIERDAVSGGNDLDRTELMLDLARVEYLAGRIPAAVDACERAAAAGERDRRTDIPARAAVIVQGIGDTATNRRLDALCRRALAAGDGDTTPHLLARVYAQLACVQLELGTLDTAIDWSAQALTAAASSGDQNAELDAILARATVSSTLAARDELAALGQRAVALAEPTGRPLAALWGRIWLSDAAVHRADMPAAEAELSAMDTLADRTRLPLVRWHTLRRRASIAALAGAFDTSRRLSADAAVLATGWNDDSVRATHLAQAVCLGLLRGDPGELPPGWQTAIGDPTVLPPVARALLAAALWLDQQPDEAETVYRPLVATVATLTRGHAAATLAFLVDLAPALGNRHDCRTVRDIVTTLYGDIPAIGTGTVFYLGSVGRILGRLANGCGDYEAAIAHFRQGLRIDTALGAQPMVARGQMGLATALTNTGDLAAATTAARTAAAAARRLDMPGLRTEADTFLAAAAAQARTHDPLTPREHQIVELVARAMTNRDVARELTLSERTIESHIRHILAKTGLTSRTDLTRWYLQQQR